MLNVKNKVNAIGLLGQMLHMIWMKEKIEPVLGIFIATGPHSRRQVTQSLVHDTGIRVG